MKLTDLLFEDILFGQAARKEHEQFKKLIGLGGCRVLEIQDVLARTLEQDEVRQVFIQDVTELEQLQPSTVEYLVSLSPSDLADAVVGGIEFEDGTFGWSLPPLPNLLFVRDPLVVAHQGAIIGSMARKSRRREPLIMQYAYGLHPELSLHTKGAHLPQFLSADDKGIFIARLPLTLKTRLALPGCDIYKPPLYNISRHLFLEPEHLVEKGSDFSRPTNS